MTEYVCDACGVKTTMRRFLEHAEGLPLTDECPNCGEVEEFGYI